MKRPLLVASVLLLVLAASVNSALAYRRGRGGGYGYGYGGGAGSTVFGSWLAGEAMLTRAAGQYNMYTAQAAKNYQDAYQHWIENQKLREATYFDMRRMNASYRAEQHMQHPPATPEQIAAFNQARLPAHLSPNEFDPAHGVMKWPNVLKRSEFDHDRGQLEKLFSDWAEDPHRSGLGTQNYRDIQRTVGQMKDTLHSEITKLSPDEYIAASKFLKSLAFEARSPGSDAVASK